MLMKMRILMGHLRFQCDRFGRHPSPNTQIGVRWCGGLKLKLDQKTGLVV